jgi:hypothetical protein
MGAQATARHGRASALALGSCRPRDVCRPSQMTISLLWSVTTVRVHTYSTRTSIRVCGCGAWVHATSVVKRRRRWGVQSFNVRCPACAPRLMMHPRRARPARRGPRPARATLQYIVAHAGIKAYFVHPRDWHDPPPHLCLTSGLVPALAALARCEISA